MTKKLSKLDKDALVFSLKRIIAEGQEPLHDGDILTPIDYAYKLIDVTKKASRRDLARDILIRLHEYGVINLSEYRDN
jgi:hypothetical protein